MHDSKPYLCLVVSWDVFKWHSSDFGSIRCKATEADRIGMYLERGKIMQTINWVSYIVDHKIYISFHKGEIRWNP